MIKLAALTLDMGSPENAGVGIANIIKFLLQRISLENRNKSTINLRNKILNLDPIEISSKKTPATASLGQSITFIKTVLQGHSAAYISAVLKEVAKNL